MYSRASYITYHLHAYHTPFSNVVPIAILKIALHLVISLYMQLCVHSKFRANEEEFPRPSVIAAFVLGFTLS